MHFRADGIEDAYREVERFARRLRRRHNPCIFLRTAVLLLRSTPILPVHLLAVAVAFSGALAAAAMGGCTSASTTAAFSDRSGGAPPSDQEGVSGSFDANKTADAAAPKAGPYRGNPLCYVSSTCVPDAPTCSSSNAPDQPDGGNELDGGTGTAPSLGCRLGRGPNEAILPQCLSATLSGGDGAACVGGADCAPGFDCVAGDKDQRSCRRYCCSGSCRDNTSNAGDTFCDVQTLVDVGTSAPVCLPIKRCTHLVGNEECGADESCSVVTEDGDTGCVTVGTRQAGESCDETHCAAQLTCLGQPGARRCFQLCRVAENDCKGSEVCVTSAAFKEATFGICQ